MCNVIIICGSGDEIGTPREFQSHFGFLPTLEGYHTSLDLDCCLCQCDLDDTFQKNSIEYKAEYGDYYVG